MVHVCAGPKHIKTTPERDLDYIKKPRTAFADRVSREGIAGLRRNIGTRRAESNGRQMIFGTWRRNCAFKIGRR